jgi:hypothetical protein
MRVRAIDDSHDWTFGNNMTDYKGSSEAIKQCVLTAVLSVRGDWFLALEHGIDWFNYLGRSTNMALFESDLKSAILKVDGVYKITNIVPELNREQRHAVISIEYIDVFSNKMVVQANVNN